MYTGCPTDADSMVEDSLIYMLESECKTPVCSKAEFLD